MSISQNIKKKHYNLFSKENMHWFRWRMTWTRTWWPLPVQWRSALFPLCSYFLRALLSLIPNIAGARAVSPHPGGTTQDPVLELYFRRHTGIHTAYSVHKCVQYFITLGIENFRILILNLHFKLTTKLGSIAFKNESLRGGWGGTEHYNTVYEYVNNTQEKRCYCTN